jgi:hypothetical protein
LARDLGLWSAALGLGESGVGGFLALSGWILRVKEAVFDDCAGLRYGFQLGWADVSGRFQLLGLTVLDNYYKKTLSFTI